MFTFPNHNSKKTSHCILTAYLCVTLKFENSENLTLSITVYMVYSVNVLDLYVSDNRR